MNHNLSEVMQGINLLEIISDYFPDAGANPALSSQLIYATWRGNSNSASFSVYPYQGTTLWCDKATGEAGNALTFLTKIVGLDEAKARAELERYSGKKLLAPGKKHHKVFSDDYEPPREAENKPVDQITTDALLERLKDNIVPGALKGRGFTRTDMSAFFMIHGGHTKDDLLFPIFNPQGQVVAWKRRLFSDAKQRYAYEQAGHGNPPQCLHTDREYILIVEGELNAMIAAAACAEAGETRLGFMGVAGAEGRLYHDVLRNKSVAIYSDGDEPGAKARETWRNTAIYAGANEVFELTPFEVDFCDIAAREGKEGLFAKLRDALAAASKVYSPLDREVGGYTVSELLELGDKFISGTGGIETGFWEIDGATGGLPESGVVLIGALSSVGKSSYMRAILKHHLDSHANDRVALFSPDQSAAAIFRLFAADACQVPAWQIKRNLFSKDVLSRYNGDVDKIIKTFREAYQDMVLSFSKRLLVYDETNMQKVIKTVEPLLDKGVTMVAGDYAQLFEAGGGYGGEEDDGDVASLWKVGARRWKVPVVLPIQLAKYKFGANVKRSGIPMVSDIEGKGKWSQIAEMIFLLYSQDIYLKEFRIEPADYKDYNEHDVGRHRVIVGKHKEGGRFGYYYLTLDESYVTFRNLEG